MPHEIEFLGLFGIEQVADAIVRSLMHFFHCVEAIDGGERLVLVDVEQFGLAAFKNDLHHALLGCVQTEAVGKNLKLLIESRVATNATLSVRRTWLTFRLGRLILRGRRSRLRRLILRSAVRADEQDTLEGEQKERRFSG